jgi:alpha-beta hydrolase superfamily lysophospholipase
MEIYEATEDCEINEQGDKYYKVDSRALLFDLIEDWNDGTIEVQDILLKREYIDAKGEQIRLNYTEIMHKNDKPKATIAILHGFGQNSDLFVELGIQFALNGYIVQAIDFRGYGWSGGRRVEHTLIEMQDDIVALLKESDPDIPLFLYSHSMGGLITFSFLMNNPDLNISGVISQAPVTASPEFVKIDSFRLMLVKFLGQEIPELLLNARINTSSVSKKAIVMKWMLSSRKVVPILGVRQAHIISYLMHHFFYNAKSFTHPVLIHLANDDKVVNNNATKKFFEKIGSEDKQMFEYDGVYHELQYEDCAKEMFRNNINWLNARFKEGNTFKLGAIDFDKIKVALLKKKAPFKQWKLLITSIVLAYYAIGYLLMISKIVNKDRHEMIAFWPCSLFKKFFGKK